jgi:phage antirepressor YoqD-like protein
MNENKTMMINDTAVVVKEYQGKRVVTLKEIDQCHGRPDGTAKRNFQQNKQHLIDGIDYFTVKPSDVQKNEFRTFEIPNRGLTLITESGYLMLVKSFTDKLAWDVQRQLVNTYFRNQGSTSTEIKVCDESTDKIIDAYLPQADEPTRMLLRATFMAMNNLSNQVGVLKTENKALEAENTKKENIIQENQPKVDFAEGITASKGTISMSQFAKMVSKETGKTIGRNAILLWLRQQKILMRTNEPYQMYKKYFEYIPVLNHWGKGGFATRVTGKGQQWLFERLRKAGVIGEKKNTKLVSVSVVQGDEDDLSWVDEI